MTLPVIANGVIAAENDLQMRGLLRSVLTHAGQQVFPAADGEEAVALARQFKARLVLLDVAMPRVNGLQACDTIRRLPGYADVPIVILTGYDEERLRVAALRFATKVKRAPTPFAARRWHSGNRSAGGRIPTSPWRCRTANVRFLL